MQEPEIQKTSEVKPYFSVDYLNHSPAEFVASRLVNEAGEEKYAFTFIDHKFVPVVDESNGRQEHTVKLERIYRSSILIDVDLWEKMVAVVQTLGGREEKT